MLRAEYWSDDDEFGDFLNESDDNDDAPIEKTPLQRLYSALINQDVQSIMQELNEGVDINTRIQDNWTPILIAVSIASCEVFDALLKRGANPRAEINDQTSLMIACSIGKFKCTEENVLYIVQKLIKAGVNPKICDRRKTSAFMMAAEQGFYSVVEYLLPISDMQLEDSRGRTALHYAARANNPRIVKMLIEAGLEIDHVDIFKTSIKDIANKHDLKDILDLLPPDEPSPENFYEEISLDNLPEDYSKLRFQSDIHNMLYSMNCSAFIPMFTGDMDLFKFLTLNDQDLKELGIELPFKRKQILAGLHRFHGSPWEMNASPLLPNNNVYTDFQILLTLLNAIKSVSIMKSSIMYTNQNWDGSDNKDIEKILSGIILKLDEINTIVKHIKPMYKKHDENTRPCDLISKKHPFPKYSLKKYIFYFLCLSTSVIPIKAVWNWFRR